MVLHWTSCSSPPSFEMENDIIFLLYIMFSNFFPVQSSTTVMDMQADLLVSVIDKVLLSHKYSAGVGPSPLLLTLYICAFLSLNQQGKEARYKRMMWTEPPAAQHQTGLNKWGQRQLDLLRRVWSFAICSAVLQIFSPPVIAIIISHTAVLRGSRARAAYHLRINKLISLACWCG